MLVTKADKHGLKHHKASCQCVADLRNILDCTECTLIARRSDELPLSCQGKKLGLTGVNVRNSCKFVEPLGVS